MVFMYLASLQGVACFSCSRRLPDLATSQNPAVMSINVLKHWWRISTFIETKEGSLTGLFCWLSLQLLQQQMSCSWMSHCSASCRGSMMFAIVLLWLFVSCFATCFKLPFFSLLLAASRSCWWTGCEGSLCIFLCIYSSVVWACKSCDGLQEVDECSLWSTFGGGKDCQ